MKILTKIFLPAMIIASLFSFAGCNKKQNSVTIGLYSNTKKINFNMEEVIKEISTSNEINVKFVEIDENLPLETQIKQNKIDAIITPAGTTLNKSIKNVPANCGVSYELTDLMFSTMKQATKTQNKNAVAIPLIIDHLEIDIDTQAFMDSGMKAINTWQDIENFCEIQQKRIKNPITFTGNDAVFLLDLLGALAEAQSGVEAYNQAVEILNKEENIGEHFNAMKVAEELINSPKAPLVNAKNYLMKLAMKDYLNPNTKAFTDYDVDINAQNRTARVLFTNLSNHRSYNAKGMSYFSTMYMPSKNAVGSRHFTANVTYFVPVQKSDALVTILENLVSPEYQSELSRRTGLAPVLANCRTPDKQADDVRYWISATEVPLAGLGHETSLTKDQLNTLKDEILNSLF